MSVVIRAQSQLGCPEWRVVITERGGAGSRVELPFDTLSFNRVANEISTSRVSLPTSGSARSLCCDLLNGLPPSRVAPSIGAQPPIDVWAHELHLYADTYLAWAGPLTGMEFSKDKIELTGRDLFAWFERRFLHLHDRLLHADLADMFNIIVLDALEEDDSPNIVVHAKPTGVTGNRQIIAANWARAADELRELLRTGLDFTVVGRDILAGSVELLLPDELRLWDPVATLAKYTRVGDDLATRFAITGELRAQRVNVSLGGVDSLYGLLEAHETELSIKDDESAYSAANSRWQLLKKPPSAVTIELSPQGPGLPHLVPGSRCDVRLSGEVLGCRDVKETMRLSGVSVGVDQTGTTKVELTPIPLGRVVTI